MTTTKTVYLSNPSVTIGGVDVTQNTSAANARGRLSIRSSQPRSEIPGTASCRGSKW
jgi:hypothetical protein